MRMLIVRGVKLKAVYEYVCVLYHNWADYLMDNHFEDSAVSVNR